MSDEASPGGLGNAAVDAGPVLTPEAIETVLGDFRGWLQMAAGVADTVAPPEETGFSLQTLVAEFTALRQEINLLTRAARTQQEQNAETLRLLGGTVDALEETSAQAADDSEAKLLRPLLKTLVDVYDALALARREVQRVDAAIQRVVPDESTQAETTIEPQASATRRWWQWWSIPTAARAPKPTAADECRRAADQVRQFFTSVVTGYTMSLQRIDRVLQEHQLEPIVCVGEVFDPECMEVVEVVAEPGRRGTEVLEEVQRGYRWRGRLFRYARVRVARP
jgi:molecular chaperone GrpE